MVCLGADVIANKIDGNVMGTSHEIWFITGSQDLYGEETLKQVAEQSQAVMATLASGLKTGVKLVWKPTLKNADAIRRTMLDASADDNCIGVITWMHTFSPAKMWIQGLDLRLNGKQADAA